MVTNIAGRLVHSGDKPYSCLRLNIKVTNIAHRLVYSGDKPYSYLRLNHQGDKHYSEISS